MIIKKEMIIGLFSILALSNSAFATHQLSNLYINFQKSPSPQKVYIDVIDDHQKNSIECSTQKGKSINKGPSCGFGFTTSPVMISQIKYSTAGSAPIQICSELKRKQFIHGTLFIFHKTDTKNTIHCILKKTKTNRYPSK